MKALFLFFILPLTLFAEDISLNNAYLDLSSYAWVEGDKVSLSGDWQFYPSQFITSPTYGINGYIQELPGPLNIIDNGVSSPFGYGTYMSVIDIGDKPRDFYLIVPMIKTAAKIYVNGVLKFSSGNPGPSSETSLAQLNQGVIDLTNLWGPIRIAIQISNYDIDPGGLHHPIKLILKNNYLKKVSLDQHLDMLMIGIFLSLLIQQFISFFITRQVANIHTGLLGLVLISRTYFSIFIEFINQVTSLSIGQIERINTLILILGSNLGYRITKDWFPKESNKVIQWIVDILSVILSLIIIFAPLSMVTKSLLVFQIFIVFVAVLVAVIAFLALKHKRRNSYWYSIIYFALIALVINDILYSYEIIHTGYYVGYGLIVLILVQFVMVIHKERQNLFKIRSYRDQLEGANLKLRHMNDNLERLVFVRTRSLETELKIREEEAFKDSLTGVWNRRGFEKLATRAEDIYAHSQISYSIVLIDLDFFKQLNDTYGHKAGDEALQFITNHFLKHIRPDDLFVRWGGEEFLLLYDSCTLNNAYQAVELIRKDLDNSKFIHNGKRIIMSFTAGIAERKEAMSLESCLQLADDRLYKGKGSGRNKTVID